jgi:gliding motility-associated-like protein
MQEITYDIVVYDPPNIDFTYTQTGCAADTTFFSDASNGLGRSVVKWQWDFGDGTTDSVKNPFKKFNSPNTYNVKLVAYTELGCLNNVTKPINITQKPLAKFGVADNSCINSAVTITDMSSIASGAIVKWIWNFGDGSAQIVNTTNGAVSHTYNTAGKYTVTLEVESNTGCKSALTVKEIIINTSPVPDFTFSQACLPKGNVQFTNLSTIGDGSEATLSYSWRFGDNSSASIKDPAHKYGSVGPFDVVLSVTSAQGCFKEVTKSLNTIYPQPKANFSGNAETCFKDSSIFKDESNQGNIVKWRWNFGDGTTDTIQNPSHLYAASKTYTVSLFVYSDKGCVSDTIVKDIVVNPLPTADFKTTSPSCETQQITISDISTANAGNITNRAWTFGDGTTANYSNANPFSKTYSTAGAYDIKLIIQTGKGCKSDTTKTLKISNLPVANFILPEVCLNDASADFVDSSYIADGSESSFSYTWNFGDANATPANQNTSTQKNPKHKFVAVGNYNISLAVTSKDGCSSTITRPFTVNGSNPIAGFTVLNSNNLCSNSAVQIKNISTVTPGNITKVEILWDALGAPSTIFTDDNPSFNKVYTNNYPLLSITKKYQIKFKAYSGGTCINEVTQEVIVNGSPKVSFTPMPDICLSEVARQITQASETTGVSGSFIYSGKGVSSSGLFTPAIAGEGTSPIKYIYTSDKGCKDSALQSIIVYPNPQVNAGPDLFVLEGGFVVINADAKGDNLTYKWSPPTYLDNDGILEPRLTPLTDVTYRLTVTSRGACAATDDVSVKVLKAPTVPNVFSPNNDGINDVWNIQYLETYPNAVVEIYNRYGQQVFKSSGYSRPWDGKMNGNVLPTGVYYYIINPRNGRQILTGSLTLLR